MKKLLYTLMIALAAFAIAGCDKPEEKTPDAPKVVPEISVLTTSFSSIPDVGGTFSVAITSNADWAVTIQADADWLSVNPSNGEAGEEISITFTAAANENYDKRTATVTVSCKNANGEDSAEFTITQKQKGALILTDDVVEVGYEGGKVSVTLNANSDVSYAIADDAKDWIVPVAPNGAPTRALVESTYDFNVLPNAVKQEREGVITFTNEAGSETVTIKQEALPEPDPELSISPAAISGVAVDGATVKLALTSNMPWVVSIPDGVNWLTVSPNQGEAGENIEVTVTIQGHDANDGRNASLTFTCTNAENESKEVVVSISQDGLNIPTDVHIGTAADLIKFADDYESGYYDTVLDILTVTLDADIAFNETTSASFMGIGSGLNPFKASFDGANHAISGLVATAPLFPFIDSDATVKNLVIDSSCSFNFTHPNIAAVNFGAVAGYLKGTLDNVKVAADINLAAVADVKFLTNLGGLAGIVWEGSIKNCEYSGLISAPAGFTVLVPADDTSNRKLIIGGLAAFVGGTGKVEQSYFKGAIVNAALVEAADTDNRYLKDTPYLIIGGLVGYLDVDATVTSSNATADHAAVAGAHSSSAGQIVNKTTMAFNSVVGGIVGLNNSGTVSQCNNGALVFNSIFKTAADASRYMKTGGIVGMNNADGVIDGCNNTNKIQHRSNPKLQDIAGIAGYNAGTVKNCTNSGDVNHMTTGVSGAANKGGRIVSIAGIVGENAAGAIVSNVSNTASIQISAMEDGTKSEARMGGIIAYNLADIDGGEAKNITNSGTVYFSPTFANQFLGYELGGVVGYSTGSIRNVKNTGYVNLYWNSDANIAKKMYLGGVVGKMDANGVISGCINVATEAANSGEVNLNLKSGKLHEEVYAGGILGYTDKNVAISDCSNGGFVHNSNYAAKSYASFIGGIVGYLTGTSSISDCSNTGEVYNNQSNNDDTATASSYCGGMAGYVKGASENIIPISNCTNSSEKTHSRRGYVGGIAGYVEYANLTGCTFSKSIVNSDTSSSLSRWLGGIVGWAANSSITSCTFSGTTLQATQLSANANSAGGIAAKLDACTVDGCYSHVATINNATADVDGGAIVGRSGDGNTIKNCHYKATINGAASKIAATGTFTGEGNVADVE